jgi:hypothetical protein
MEDFQLREEHWVIADLMGNQNAFVSFLFQHGRNESLMSGPWRLTSAPA